jgi:hypothetical protein
MDLQLLKPPAIGVSSAAARRFSQLTAQDVRVDARFKNLSLIKTLLTITSVQNLKTALPVMTFSLKVEKPSNWAVILSSKHLLTMFSLTLYPGWKGGKSLHTPRPSSPNCWTTCSKNAGG